MTSAKSTAKIRDFVNTGPAAARKSAKSNRAAVGSLAKATSVARKASNPAVKSNGAAPAGVAKARPKVVRDSYTIPKAEYAVLQGLKLRAAKLARLVKKSELLRAGVAALSAMSDEAFLAALSDVPSLKTGRPKDAGAAPAAVKRSK